MTNSPCLTTTDALRVIAAHLAGTVQEGQAARFLGVDIRTFRYMTRSAVRHGTALVEEGKIPDDEWGWLVKEGGEK